MLARLTAAMAIVITLVAACGGSSPKPQGATAAGVSVQPSDLPSGMVKCDLSGDINTFLDKEKTPDPATYQAISKDWQSEQKLGATSAYVAFYADSSGNCSAVRNPNLDIGAATYKLVINFVVQYKDSKSAENAYTNGPGFEFSPSRLRSGGQQTVEGTKTGLTANSITLFASVPPQSYYIADWQNKTFRVILAILNLDQGTSNNVALKENARIK